jgi:hypothetical protein
MISWGEALGIRAEQILDLCNALTSRFKRCSVSPIRA